MSIFLSCFSINIFLYFHQFIRQFFFEVSCGRRLKKRKKKMTQAQVFKTKNQLKAHKLALKKLLQMKEQQKRDLEVVSYYLA